MCTLLIKNTLYLKLVKVPTLTKVLLKLNHKKSQKTVSFLRKFHERM